MRFQHFKLSSSGVDLGGEMLFSTHRLGFSGTPSALLPRELGGCEYELGSEGQITTTLTDPTIASVMRVEEGWTPKSLLRSVIDLSLSEPSAPIRALIDTGAQVTGLSNRDVAEFLIENGLPVEGVVYLDDDDRKMVYVRATRRDVQLAECGIPERERFAFYDQVHTTGMDIKHTPDARAVITLGKDMGLRDFAQGAYRMRGIDAGQRIIIFMTPEVDKLATRELAKCGEPDIVVPFIKRPPSNSTPTSDAPTLGVEFEFQSPPFPDDAKTDERSLIITRVLPDSPAEARGVQPGAVLSRWYCGPFEDTPTCFGSLKSDSSLSTIDAVHAALAKAQSHPTVDLRVHFTPRAALDPDLTNPATSVEPHARELQRILAWLILNAMRTERLQNGMLQLQDCANVFRIDAFNALLRTRNELRGEATGDAISVFKEDVKATLMVKANLKPDLSITDALTDTFSRLGHATHALSACSDGERDHILKYLIAQVTTTTGVRSAECVDNSRNADGDDSRDLTLDTEAEREAEQEVEQEQEREQQIQVEKFQDLAYSRDHEAPLPWEFANLAQVDRTRWHAECGLYSASDFSLYRRSRLEFPRDLHFSNNYFNRTWRGARRLKNITFVLELLIGENAQTQAVASASTPTQQLEFDIEIVPVWLRDLAGDPKRASALEARLAEAPTPEELVKILNAVYPSEHRSEQRTTDDGGFGVRSSSGDVPVGLEEEDASDGESPATIDQPVLERRASENAQGDGSLPAAAYRVGERVEAVRHGQLVADVLKRRWYSATITKALPNGTFNLRHDDGEMEWRVRPECLRKARLGAALCHISAAEGAELRCALRVFLLWSSEQDGSGTASSPESATRLTNNDASDSEPRYHARPELLERYVYTHLRHVAKNAHSIEVGVRAVVQLWRIEHARALAARDIAEAAETSEFRATKLPLPTSPRTRFVSHVIRVCELREASGRTLDSIEAGLGTLDEAGGLARVGVADAGPLLCATLGCPELLDAAAVRRELHDPRLSGGLTRGQFNRLLISPSLRGEESGDRRRFVVISLAEAETLRRILHARATARSLVDGRQLELALRCIPLGIDLDMGASRRFHQSPASRFQLERMRTTLRFVDGQVFYKPSEQDLLVHSLQLNTCFERQLFFEQVVGCRRRLRLKWDKTPLQKVLRTASENELLCQLARALTVSRAVQRTRLSLDRIFSLWDLSNDAKLQPNELWIFLEVRTTVTLVSHMLHPDS